jgi:hypothetical protein
MNTKKVYSSIALATLLSVAIVIPAFADTPVVPAQPTWNGPMQGMFNRGGMMGGMRKMGPAIFGTVSAVSGNTITLSGRTGFASSTSATTFTIDATNAKVEKNNATSSVSSIAIGDTLLVQGKVTGTTIAATNIRDGVMPMGRGMMGGRNAFASSTPIIQGNGEPIIAGTISAISGATLTVINKSNVTYTVDATNAQIASGNKITTLSNVALGDSVVVQGTVNGTSIIASSVIDQPKPVETKKPILSRVADVFGSIKGFFGHLFGF